MKNIPYVIITTITLFLGCETVVDINIPIEPPSLVINSTLVDDEFIRVHVSQSQHILESGDYKLLTGATIEVYENGSLLNTLPDSSQGNYISAIYKPQRGKTYDIKVSKNGFETATAEVLLPLDTADILSVKVDTIQEKEYGFTSYYLRFSIEIKDDKEYNNFYDISIYQGGYYNIYDYSVDPPVFIDSIYSYNKIFIQSRDPNLEEFQSYGNNIIFSDVLFNGNTYHMNVLSGFWFDLDYPNENEFTYFVTLGNTSESYYLYELSSQLQYWTGDNPFAQPVTVYNNIENGFGILGAYNTTVVKVE